MQLVGSLFDLFFYHLEQPDYRCQIGLIVELHVDKGLALSWYDPSQCICEIDLAPSFVSL